MMPFLYCTYSSTRDEVFWILEQGNPLTSVLSPATSPTGEETACDRV